MPQAGPFLPFCPCDELAGPGVIKLIEGGCYQVAVGVITTLYLGLCSDAVAIRGEYNEEERPAIMYPLNGSKIVYHGKSHLCARRETSICGFGPQGPATETTREGLS